MTNVKVSGLREYLEVTGKFFADHGQPNLIQDYVLEHGQEFSYSPYDYEAYGPKGRCRECFQNAFILALENGLDYCEGFYDPTIAAHHAWCLDADGKVVDPTWRDSNDTDCGLCDEGSLEVCVEWDEDDGEEIDWETIDCNYCDGTGKKDNSERATPTYLGCVFDLDYVREQCIAKGMTWGVLDKLPYPDPPPPGDLR